jgi:hypothetical protein
MPSIHEPQTMLQAGLATQKTLVEFAGLLASCETSSRIRGGPNGHLCGQSYQSSSRTIHADTVLLHYRSAALYPGRIKDGVTKR